MEHDVLIIGAGPTGLMLACQLARRGIRFRIVDKNADHTTQSRALAVHARSLEIWEQMGIAQKAIGQGRIARGANMFFGGRKAAHMVLRGFDPNLTQFPYVLMLEQSKTEALLEGDLATQGHRVERQVEVIRLTQDEQAVTSVLRRADGSEETVRTAYAVGADGAHSIVREQNHIEFGGKTYQTSLFVLDCKADLALPEDEISICFTRRTPFTGFFPLPGGRFRVIGTLPPEIEGKKEVTFEELSKDFSARIGMEVRLYDPQWHAVYHSHHRYAASFRKGRCFLAGDAAHIHSPVGAQGMNTGLQDAYNLAWKLALALQKKAGETLLDSYSQERMLIAKSLVRSTDRAFHFIINDSLMVRLLRLTLLPLLLRMVAPLLAKPRFGQRLFTILSEIGIDYRHSLLVRGASLGAFPPKAPQPGDRAPSLSHERLKGETFHLLLFTGADASHLQPIIEVAAHYAMIELQAIPSGPATQPLYEAFGISDTGYILIRPDMYLAYRSTQPDAAHFGRYLQKLTS